MKKIALIMPGQGAQYVGMGGELCSKYNIANEVFNEAKDILGFDLKKLCFDGNIEELTKTENAQPAILATSVAAFKVYMSEIGIKPVCSAGHSLGELSALTCAGAIRFSDALKIVRSRGLLMKEDAENNVGAMCAIVGLDIYEVQDVCNEVSTKEKIVVISNYNSSNQIVISGHKEALDMAIEKLQALGGKTSLLKVSGAFHSQLMKPAADKFNIELMKYKFNKLKWDVISNIDSLPYKNEDSIIDNLTKQITSPVQWKGIMEYLKKVGVTDVIEIGPGKILSKLLSKEGFSINIDSFDKLSHVEEIKNRFESIKNSNKKGSYLISRSLGIAVCTQNNNWNEEEYKKGVIEPYKKIQSLQTKIEMEGEEATIEEINQAIEMLKLVFEAKMTPKEEQIYRYNQLFEETGNRQVFRKIEMLR